MCVKQVWQSSFASPFFMTLVAIHLGNSEKKEGVGSTYIQGRQGSSGCQKLIQHFPSVRLVLVVLLWCITSARNVVILRHCNNIKQPWTKVVVSTLVVYA